jgi:DnaJ family protein C protein 8
MDLLPGIPDNDIRKRYRERSLLIHPDKCKHPQASVAFDRLKQAQERLLDEKQRALIDEAISDARMLLIRQHKWSMDDADDELRTEEGQQEWRDKTREVLVEEELRRRRQRDAQFREEGRQKKKDEDEAEERKKKREWEKAWEETRDDRVESWRDFQAGRMGEKKKKKAESGVNGEGVNGEANGVLDGRVEKKKKVKKLKVLG